MEGLPHFSLSLGDDTYKIAVPSLLIFPHPMDNKMRTTFTPEQIKEHLMSYKHNSLTVNVGRLLKLNELPLDAFCNTLAVTPQELFNIYSTCHATDRTFYLRACDDIRKVLTADQINQVVPELRKILEDLVFGK